MVFLYHTMTKILNQFYLGAPYEDLEFELLVLPEKIKGIDNYSYIGAVQTPLLESYTYTIELFYDWDILKGILLTFQDLPSEELINLRETLLEETRGEINILSAERINLSQLGSPHSHLIPEESYIFISDLSGIHSQFFLYYVSNNT